MYYCKRISVFICSKEPGNSAQSLFLGSLFALILWAVRLLFVLPVDGGQGVDDLHRFDGDGDDRLQQPENVLRVAVLASPVVRVVAYAAGLVGRHLILIDQPADGRSAVDDVALRFGGYAGDLQMLVDDHGALVDLVAALRPAHFCDGAVVCIADNL